MSSTYLVFGFVLAMTIGSLVVQYIRQRRNAPGHPACGACNYDVTGIIGSAMRCPECGAEFAQVGIVPPKGWQKMPSKYTMAAAIFFMLSVPSSAAST